MRLEIDQALASFTRFQIETIEIYIIDLRANILPFIAFRTDGHVTDPSVPLTIGMLVVSTQRHWQSTNLSRAYCQIVGFMSGFMLTSEYVVLVDSGCADFRPCEPF